MEVTKKRLPLLLLISFIFSTSVISANPAPDNYEYEYYDDYYDSESYSNPEDPSVDIPEAQPEAEPAPPEVKEEAKAEPTDLETPGEASSTGHEGHEGHEGHQMETPVEGEEGSDISDDGDSDPKIPKTLDSALEDEISPEIPEVEPGVETLLNSQETLETVEPEQESDTDIQDPEISPEPLPEEEEILKDDYVSPASEIPVSVENLPSESITDIPVDTDSQSPEFDIELSLYNDTDNITIDTTFTIDTDSVNETTEDFIIVNETTLKPFLLTSTQPTETTEFDDVLVLGKSCTQPPVTGMCRGAFPMFYFDPETRTCKQFIYGGCQGNKNMHKTANECYQKCYPQKLQTTRLLLPTTRGMTKDYLTIRGGTDASVLTFSGDKIAAKVDPIVLSDFNITNVYAFEFHFRTDSPHGLIAFLRQETSELSDIRIQLYIYLSKGHLGVKHVFGDMTETFVTNKGGLQAGNWHSASVQINAGTGDLVLDVDNHQERFTIGALGLHPHYDRKKDPEMQYNKYSSVLWIGGVFQSNVQQEAMAFGFVPFHGCIQQLSLSSGMTPSEMVRVSPLVATQHTGVQEHCKNTCSDRMLNLCSRKAHCVEHFDHNTCNCFASGQDGPRCTNPDIPILSLNGDGHVVHRLYEWIDRVHSYTNVISIGFKTRHTDSILFYASAEHPEKQYIAASITKRNTIYVEVNLGAGAVSAEFGEKIDSESWRQLIIVHQHETIQLYLNSRLYETLIVPGHIRYFHLDPDIYVGNAPRLHRACGLPLDKGLDIEEVDDPEKCEEPKKRYYYDQEAGACHPFNFTGCGGNANRHHCSHMCMRQCHVPGLQSMKPFLGCIKELFFNDVSILQNLMDNKKETRFLGTSKTVPIGTTCKDTRYLPVTFSTERAVMNLVNPQPSKFQLTLSFKPTTEKGVIASGWVNVTDLAQEVEWELRYDKKHVYFYMHDNIINMKSDAKIKMGNWHHVEVHYKSGRVYMGVNNKQQGKKAPGKLDFSPFVTIGGNVLEDYPGFVGCIRKLFIGNTKVDLRTVVGTPMVNEDVTYDNCQVLSPCESSRGCEHGGKCSIDEEGQVQCDCSGTGYSGKKCHFSLYKRSCEQYRHMGYSSDGIYHVDIDGNGPLPPSYVKCSFNSLIGETYTTIEHNLEDKFEVRKHGLKDFKMAVKYRDFTNDMLKELITISKSCSQKVEYQCRRAPLNLSSMTWFSSPNLKGFSNYGTRYGGYCRCRELKSCDRPDVACNCDINDGLLRSDKTTIRDSEHLPITDMTFVQGKDQPLDAEGYITLGPLVCMTDVRENHTMTFTETSSYLEIPAWRQGSFFLNFRTTNQEAILAYQPAYLPSHATFMISLIGEKEIEFMYHYDKVIHREILRSLKPLNNGQWQQVLIDVDNQQLRFVVNNEEKMIEVDPEAYLGTLDGSMFLGGIPEHYRKEENLTIGGMIGCIRGVTMNEQPVELNKYYRSSARGIVQGCTPSCDSNPCQNGGQCVENWGTYECVCSNPIGHYGKNCENDINTDAITFKTEESKYKYFVNDTDRYGEKILNETFLVSFRTHSDAGLLLFAYNYLHNFVQLHMTKQNQIVFLFNYGKEVHKLVVTAAEGVVFNKGHSVQLKVERSESTTTLIVFAEGSIFQNSIEVGVQLIQDYEYEQQPFGQSQPLPDMVYYPHSMTKPIPFFLAYLGSADDQQHDMRSVIPGMRGCLGGLKIGDDIISLKEIVSSSPYSRDGVIDNCNMACDKKPCMNGGKCTEDFEFYNNFHCDCKETSYYGPTCNDEIAYTFHGNQWISQDGSSSPLESDFKFEIAFSTSRKVHHKQIVTLLRSTNPSFPNDYLLVGLDTDGSMLIEGHFQDSDGSMVNGVHVTPSEDKVNVFDGLRHYVVINKAAGNDDWQIWVDGEKKERIYLHDINEEAPVKTTPTFLYLGGVDEDIDARFTKYQSFEGCVSNVHLVTPNTGVNSYPLKQYLEGDLHLKNRGIPGQGKCATFLHSSSLPRFMQRNYDTNSSAISGSAWMYKRPERVEIILPAAVKMPERDTVFDDVVPAVAGTIFAITFLILLMLFLRYKAKMKKAKRIRDMEEGKELINGVPQVKVVMRTPTDSAPETTEETIPLKLAPDGILEGSVNEAPVQELKETPEMEPAGVDEVDVIVDDKPVEDIPKVIDTPEKEAPVEDKSSNDSSKIASDDTEVQIHKEEDSRDSAEHEGVAEDSRDSAEQEGAVEDSSDSAVQVRKKSDDTDVGGESEARPLSWDKSTDNLPLIIGKENGAVNAQPDDGSSSESEIDCTLDINITPPNSPTEASHPMPGNEDISGAVKSPPTKPPRTDSLIRSSEDDSDGQPELIKHVPLSDEADVPASAEITSSAPSEADVPASAEITSSAPSEAPESSEQIDFSKVPIIKIEPSQNEDENIVVVDDEPGEKEKVNEETPQQKNTNPFLDAIEDNTEEQNTDAQPTKDTDEEFEFINPREETDKIENAERMSKVSSLPPLGSPTLVSSVEATRAASSIPETYSQASPEVSQSISEEGIDLQRYYLTKKPSIPPPLPPKEGNY